MDDYSVNNDRQNGAETMNVVNPRVRFTYEDYKTLPESMDKRYELLDGDIIMVPAPTTIHQRVSRNIGFLLIQHVREYTLGEVFYAPVDVVLGIGSDREVVQPDVVFVSKERHRIIVEEEIQGAPDLVVEVLSPGTEARDQGYKKRLYARYGVNEFWIVDPKAKTLEVYIPKKAGYQLAGRYKSEDYLKSNLFSELRLKIEELFRRD